jgi:acyl-CoA synthetase (AMP-forming)/AMP-acid ligase II
LRELGLRDGDDADGRSQGRYFIVDRKKDLIIRGGYNVCPREIVVPAEVRS